jgi:uncharacterized membrane protein (UPF0182 family)
VRWILALILAAALLLFLSADAGLYVNYLWFQSEGVQRVFTTTLGYEARAFALFGALALLFFLANLLAARRFSQARKATGRAPLAHAPRVRPWFSVIIGVTAVIVGLLFGSGASGVWQTIALAQHAVSFGAADPVLGRSVSWYVFQYPFLQFLFGWSVGLLVVTALGVGAVYAVAAPGFVQFERVQPEFGQVHVSFAPPPAVLTHGAVLLGLFFALRGAAYHWLSQAELLYNQHSTAYGANFTDANVRLPVYSILAGLMGLCVVFCAFAALRRGIGWLIAAPVVWISALVLGLGVVPAVVQGVFVAPSELKREAPYIANNIAATRAAFNLNAITISHPTVTALTQQDVQANPQTVQNIRLWDWRPLLDTYQQLQGLRPYYLFPDVDVDRYGGQQMMLSTRELDISKLPQAAQNWQNEHLVYTHGFGVVASGANDITSQGRPNLVLSNIPPVTSNPLLRVTQPGVYFTSGDASTSWVLVRTTAQEFDYPTGNDNASTTYSGSAGIAIGSFARRVLFAWHLGDPNLLYTSYLQPGSKILINRQISQMVHKITPFLTVDHDPYMVIINGKLYWIMDAYTTSDAYPYSAPLADGTNYIRNSVKIVIDAYNGTITYYRTDDPAHPEPIIQAYSEMFPGLFQPLAKMPSAFRAHLRYPEDLLTDQAQTLTLYHITDPTVFYNREDVWSIPTEKVGQTSTPVAPYYAELRLPGESQAEFDLIQPFVPRGKDNMIGWLAARSDPAHYGQALLYEFSKDSLIYGPQQIESNIDQEPTISSSLSLWNQQGSRVIRGTLLVIPLGNAFLYVEPLFLQSNQGQIPELKRVILADSNSVTMQPTFQEALQALFSGAPSAGASGAPIAPSTGTSAGTTATTTAATASAVTTATRTAGPAGTPGSTPAVAQDALRHYQQAQADLKAGNWAGYGTELAAMQRDLEQLASK